MRSTFALHHFAALQLTLPICSPKLHAPLVLLDEPRPRELVVSQMLPLEPLRPPTLLTEARGLLRAAPKPYRVFRGKGFCVCLRGAST